MKADLGSGAVSQGDLAKTLFPQIVASQKSLDSPIELRDTTAGFITEEEKREKNSPAHSYLINISAEMLVVMEMVTNM